MSQNTKFDPKIAEPRTSEQLEKVAENLDEHASVFRKAAKLAKTQEGEYLCLYSWKQLLAATDKLTEYTNNLRKVIVKIEGGEVVEPGQLKNRSTALNNPEKMEAIQPWIKQVQDEAKRLRALAARKSKK